MSGIAVHDFKITRGSKVGVSNYRRIHVDGYSVVDNSSTLYFGAASDGVKYSSVIMRGVGLGDGRTNVGVKARSVTNFRGVHVDGYRVCSAGGKNVGLFSMSKTRLHGIRVSSVAVRRMHAPVLFHLNTHLDMFHGKRSVRRPIKMFRGIAVQGMGTMTTSGTRLAPPSNVLVANVPKRCVAGLALRGVRVHLLNAKASRSTLSGIPRTVSRCPRMGAFNPGVPTCNI